MFIGNLKYMKFLSLMVLLSMNMNTALSQNVDEDLNKISLKYQQANQLMLYKMVNYYKNYKDKKPTETSKSILKKGINQLYMNEHNTETVVNKGISILVDHNSKTILLDKNDTTALNKSLAIDFASTKALSEEVKYKKKGGQGCYTFYFNTGKYLKSELWFNAENYEVTKIVYYLREVVSTKENSTKDQALPKLEILLTGTKINCDFDATTFSLNQFITSTDNRIQPIAKYKSYKLINNLGY